MRLDSWAGESAKLHKGTGGQGNLHRGTEELKAQGD